MLVGELSMDYLCYDGVVVVLSNSCSNCLSVMGLDASGWSLDIGERIGVASVNEEVEVEI